MSEATGRTLIALGICAAVAVACYVTGSGWCLLGLFFLEALY